MNRRNFLKLISIQPVLYSKLLSADSNFEPSSPSRITSRELRMMLAEGDLLWSDQEGNKTALETLTNHSIIQPSIIERSSVDFRSEIMQNVEMTRYYWWSKPNKTFPVWPERDKALDYIHTSNFSPQKGKFQFSANDLDFLVQRNHFRVSTESRFTVFGLRGCSIAKNQNQTAWSQSHSLELKQPDHMNMNCVIGIWNRDQKKIILFRGSTVPEVTHMFLYIMKLAGSNLLPTGHYLYKEGTHRPTSINPQFGALRQADKNVVVLRSPTDLSYDISHEYELWDIGMPYDNIHAAYFYGTKSNPRYSSAGCQVIEGSHVNRNSRGPWSVFQRELGLMNNPRNKSSYSYVLFTGEEANLAANKEKLFVDTYSVIRFGSSGKAVKGLQKTIGITQDGDFKTNSVKKLIEYQTKVKQPATGIALV